MLRKNQIKSDVKMDDSNTKFTLTIPDAQVMAAVVCKAAKEFKTELFKYSNSILLESFFT